MILHHREIILGNVAPLSLRSLPEYQGHLRHKVAIVAGQRRQGSIMKFILLPAALLSVAVVTQSGSGVTQPLVDSANKTRPLFAFNVAARDVPEVCSRNGGEFIEQCPRTCKAACRNPLFNRTRDIARLCDRLFVASRRNKSDAAVCLASVDANIIGGNSETYKQARERCEKEFPSIEDGVIEPAGKPAPGCVGSFPQMECRFKSLAKRAESFIQLTKAISRRKYDSTIGREMCRIRRATVESDYKKSEQVFEPLQVLKKDYEEELDCFNEVKEWIYEGRKKCEPNDRLCDKRNKMLSDIVENDLAESTKLKGSVGESVKASRKSINDIKVFWRDYTFLCKVN